MPPKFAANAALPPTTNTDAHDLETIVGVWPPPLPGVVPPLRIMTVGGSDIHTYVAETIVIATDDLMKTRNERHRRKFHEFAGDNLKVWNELCNSFYRPDPVTGRLGRRLLRLREAGTGSAVRAPGETFSEFGDISCCPVLTSYRKISFSTACRV